MCGKAICLSVTFLRCIVIAARLFSTVLFPWIAFPLRKVGWEKTRARKSFAACFLPVGFWGIFKQCHCCTCVKSSFLCRIKGILVVESVLRGSTGETTILLKYLWLAYVWFPKCMMIPGVVFRGYLHSVRWEAKSEV